MIEELPRSGPPTRNACFVREPHNLDRHLEAVPDASMRDRDIPLGQMEGTRAAPAESSLQPTVGLACLSGGGGVPLPRTRHRGREDPSARREGCEFASGRLGTPAVRLHESAVCFWQRRRGSCCGGGGWRGSSLEGWRPDRRTETHRSPDPVAARAQPGCRGPDQRPSPGLSGLGAPGQGSTCRSRSRRRLIASPSGSIGPASSR